MGVYINPIDDKTPFEKEQKILEKGERITHQEFISLEPGKDGWFGVVLLDNGSFIAAGVAFDVNERYYMSNLDSRVICYVKIHIDRIQELEPTFTQKHKVYL